MVTLEQVLFSPKMREILQSVRDEALREQLGTLAGHCLAALENIKRIHLPQDHFEEGAEIRPPNDRHQEIAPYALGAVISIKDLISYVMNTFPAPAEEEEPGFGDDFDLEFDLVDGPDGGGGLAQKPSGTERKSPAEELAEASHAFGGMVRTRVVNFGQRLQQAQKQEEVWPLLAELDEYKHRLSKAVQGLLFGVLSVFTDSAKREEILPEYRSAVGEAIALRASLSDLSHHIGRFNEAIAAEDPDLVVPLVVGVADRLGVFCSRPPYRTLRAEDKKAVLDFRRTLHGLRHARDGIRLLPLRHAVEGFSKFLESMQAINHREVLVLHDRRTLEDCLGEFDAVSASLGGDLMAARQRVIRAIEILTKVRGRNPDLDRLLREATEVPGDLVALTPFIQRWRMAAANTLATVG